MAKKKLSDFFGILSKETGKSMMKDYKRIRKEQMKLTKERIKRFTLSSALEFLLF